MKLWALGRKGWVEVRSCRVAPKRKLSRAKVMVPESVDRYGYYQPSSSITLQQINFAGGKFIASFPSRKFTGLTSLSLKVGEVKAIPTALHPVIKDNWYAAQTAQEETLSTGPAATQTPPPAS